MKKILLVCIALFALMLVFTACGKDKNPLPSTPGLYDKKNTLIATWDDLVNTYGMKVDIDYSDTGIETDTVAPSTLLAETDALQNGTQLVIGNITKIGDMAFKGCTRLTNIVLSNGVTSIGNSAFSNCTDLKSITLSDSVTSIGNSAFSHCTDLETVTIPNSVTSIGSYAFYYCNSLNSITIPERVTSIDERVFAYCTNLKNVIIPDGVTLIGNSAFGHCTCLTSITIPNSVTSIKGHAFYNCTDLIHITFSGTMAEWNAIEKSFDDNFGAHATEVVCSDGTVALK